MVFIHIQEGIKGKKLVFEKNTKIFVHSGWNRVENVVWEQDKLKIKDSLSTP